MSDEETYVLLPLTKKEVVILWPLLQNCRNENEHHIKESTEPIQRFLYQWTYNIVDNLLKKVDPEFKKISMEAHQK